MGRWTQYEEVSDLSLSVALGCARLQLIDYCCLPLLPIANVLHCTPNSGYVYLHRTMLAFRKE
jgi:hypothetical protein